METTTGLTQLAVESDYESESDDNSDVEQVYEVKEEKRKACETKYKLICVAISVVILIVLGITVINLIVLQKQSNTNTSDQQALFIISDLMHLNVSYNNFNDKQKTDYMKAFKAFDKNGDQFLDETEFTDYFKLQLKEWHIFDRIDSDSNNMLSYAECVTYLKEINKVNEVQMDLITKITHPIIVEYGVEIDENELNSLFLEYATLFMYFEEFKYDSTGNIHKSDYLSISASNQFVATDIDKNNKITVGELSIILYGDASTDKSWKYKLHEIFGNNYKNVMYSLSNIEITEEMVKNVQNRLQISPNEINHMIHKMATNHSKANKEHICFSNNYCYYSYITAITHIYQTPIEHEIIDAIFPENELNEQEKQRVKDAANICDQQHCCREDDDKINFYGFGTQYSKCASYGYLGCLSSGNDCVWDCGLPQMYSSYNTIRYKRIFRGIDRRQAYKMEHWHTTNDIERETIDLINMDYLSLDVMDKCGTTYEYQLTEESKRMEYNNVINRPAYYQKQATSSSGGGWRRRLSRFSKSGEMNEATRRKLAVMGHDARVAVTWKADPWYKNVYMEFESKEGTMRCSGSLISKRHVLTAGHCVSDGKGNYYTNFRVYPSYGAGNTGSDMFTASKVVAFRGWHLWKNYNWDLGVVALDVTDTGYGWFSFGFNDNISKSDWFGVNGYPSDKGKVMQHQWMQMDHSVSYNLMLTSSGDIVGGNSGGPAWNYLTQVINGVVSHETYTGYWTKTYLYNGLARITMEKYNALCAYLDTFNETIDHCINV